MREPSLRTLLWYKSQSSKFDSAFILEFSTRLSSYRHRHHHRHMMLSRFNVYIFIAFAFLHSLYTAMEISHARYSLSLTHSFTLPLWSDSANEKKNIMKEYIDRRGRRILNDLCQCQDSFFTCLVDGKSLCVEKSFKIKGSRKNDTQCITIY